MRSPWPNCSRKTHTHNCICKFLYFARWRSPSAGIVANDNILRDVNVDFLWETYLSSSWNRHFKFLSAFKSFIAWWEPSFVLFVPPIADFSELSIWSISSWTPCERIVTNYEIFKLIYGLRKISWLFAWSLSFYSSSFIELSCQCKPQERSNSDCSHRGIRWVQSFNL